jgi:hypothetical protein
VSAADLDPFRDPILGAESYRRDLLRDRRDDLAVLPPVVREVAVRRAGRVGGGVAATVTAGALGLLAAVAYLWGFPEGVNRIFPGPDPAPLATLLLIACVAAPVGVLLGRAAGERAWRRAMSRCVMPGGNASDDIDRLAVERPLVAGRRLALRIEGASVGLPVFGVMLLGPALFVAARGAVVAGGYPEVAALEDALIRLAPWLAFSGIGGLVVALVLRGGLRRWTTAQLGRRVLAFAGIATVLLPFLAVAGAAALLGALALLGVRRERRRLGLGDSHAAALDSGLGRALAVRRADELELPHEFLRPCAGAAADPPSRPRARRARRRRRFRHRAGRHSGAHPSADPGPGDVAPRTGGRPGSHSCSRRRAARRRRACLRLPVIP